MSEKKRKKKREKRGEGNETKLNETNGEEINQR